MRTRQEAQADVIYGHKHPHLKQTFRFFTFIQDTSMIHTAVRVLAFRLPQFGDWWAAEMLRLVELCERFGLRGMWLRLQWYLRRYYYWRGVKDGLGSYAALKEYLGEDWIERPARKRAKVVAIDLSKGIPAIEGLNGYKAVCILLKGPCS